MSGAYDRPLTPPSRRPGQQFSRSAGGAPGSGSSEAQARLGSTRLAADRRSVTSTKIVIAGGFGVGKTTFTVAVDFGRITLAEDLVLYLFGTPGQKRFWFRWDDLYVGAIVVVDTERLDEAFSPLDYFESKGIPFMVAVNHFEGTHRYPIEEVAAALALPTEVPIIGVDARDRQSCKQALVRVTEYALTRLTQAVAVPAV